MYSNKPFKLLYNKLFIINSNKIKQINPLLDEKLLRNKFEVEKMRDMPVLLCKDGDEKKDIIYKKNVIESSERAILLSEFNTTNDTAYDKFNYLDQTNQNFDFSKELLNQVDNCNLCSLSINRKNAVLQRGNVNASWFVVGDSPNEQDELVKEPFSGESGVLLNKMLQAIGVDFNNDAYITNIVKCKTDINRNPTFEQISACKNYLVQQIRLVKPKIILSLGKDIIDILLYNKLPLNKVRGNTFYFENIPIIVTFSPAYLLRNNEAKRLAWQDLQFALKIRNSIN